MKRNVAILLLVAVFLSGCNAPSKSSASSIAAQSSEASQAASSDVEKASSIPPSNKPAPVTLTKSDCFDDIESISNVNASMIDHGLISHDFTPEELIEFKKLLNQMEFRIEIENYVNPGGGSRGIITIEKDGEYFLGIYPDLNYVHYLDSTAGPIYVTKGGDEMMNFIWGLDIFADNTLKADNINEYIDQQEKNNIPCTLERIE